MDEDAAFNRMADRLVMATKDERAETDRLLEEHQRSKYIDDEDRRWGFHTTESESTEQQEGDYDKTLRFIRESKEAMPTLDELRQWMRNGGEGPITAIEKEEAFRENLTRSWWDPKWDTAPYEHDRPDVKPMAWEMMEWPSTDPDLTRENRVVGLLGSPDADGGGEVSRASRGALSGAKRGSSETARALKSEEEAVFTTGTPVEVFSVSKGDWVQATIASIDLRLHKGKSMKFAEVRYSNGASKHVKMNDPSRMRLDPTRVAPVGTP